MLWNWPSFGSMATCAAEMGVDEIVGWFVASGCELSCFNPYLQDQITGIDGDRRCA